MADIYKANSKTSSAPEPTPFTSKGSTIDQKETVVPEQSYINLVKESSTIYLESEENKLNQKILEGFHQQFTPQLINLITTTEFEYGLDNPIDDFIHNLLAENKFATMIWLTSVFYHYYNNPTIVIGILHIISRMSYERSYPLGPTIASFALINANTEVKECGIRAFENWNNLHSLRVLEGIDIKPLWLQSYVSQVIEGIKKEHIVPVS